MTDDLRARIECALGLHPAIRDGQTAPLSDAVMEIVQPIVDERDRLAAELEENTGVLKALRRQRDQAEAERDRLRTGMEDLFTRWFLNAHAGLGFREAMMGIAADMRNILANADVHVCKPHASLYYCPTAGEIESSCHGGFDTCCGAPELHRPAVTNHTYEGEAGPAQPCRAEAFGETCGGAWEQHEMREACQHQDPKRLGARPSDLALVCACGAEVSPGPRTTLDNPLTSINAVDNPKEQP